MLEIRHVKKEDLKLLGGIYVKVYKFFDTSEKWIAETSEKLMEYWFNRQPDLAFLAEYNGKIVGGFFSGIKPWWDGNHLFDGEVFVHPDFQKKKIGKMLFKKLLTEALEKYDAKMFEAITFSSPEFPLSYYKKIGFRVVTELVIISGDVKKIIKNLQD